MVFFFVFCFVLKTFSSARSFDQLGRQGDMRDHSAEILFQSFLRDIIVSSSDIGRDVHSLASSSQHFLCRSWRRPRSEVPRVIIWESLLRRMTCPNHAVCWKKRRRRTMRKKERKKSHFISSHRSLNREGRLGTTDDFATSFLHFSLFSTALWTWRTPGLPIP